MSWKNSKQQRNKINNKKRKAYLNQNGHFQSKNRRKLLTLQSLEQIKFVVYHLGKMFPLLWVNLWIKLLLLHKKMKVLSMSNLTNSSNQKIPQGETRSFLQANQDLIRVVSIKVLIQMQYRSTNMFSVLVNLQRSHDIFQRLYQYD